jgi:predicted NBD/HSP70 family sugar kinase
VDRRHQGAFQRLVGQSAVATLAAETGGHGAPYLDELARRLALGVAAAATILDPGLVVLSGETALAAGPALAERVRDAVPRIAPVHPAVALSTIGDPGPLRGATWRAVELARRELLDRAGSEP